MSQSQLDTQPQPPPHIVMLQMISGFWISRAIYIAAKLGIADLLADGKTAEEIAAATGSHAGAIYRIMRALSSVGVFTEDDERRFSSTPLGDTLRTGAPGSLRAFATVELGEEHYPAWGDLLYSVKTGEIAFDKTFGMPVWDYFAKNPENARAFDDAMTAMTLATEEAILTNYDASGISKLVDIAGGQGGLLAALLKANPEMKGILFDLPDVVDGARKRVEAEGLSDRCEVVAGSFFESVPEGADAYMLKWIIHDWDDERSIAILKNIRQAIDEGGRLLLVEAVLPAGGEPHFGKFIDLNMMVMTGGRERTEEEYRALLEAGGFKLTRVIPTDSPMSIVEAAPK
jgi:hypothetical protein